jgi:hypothetical protein
MNRSATTDSIWRSLPLTSGNSARARIGRLRIELHRAEEDWWILTEELQVAQQDLAQAEQMLDPWSFFAGKPPEPAAFVAQPHLEVQRVLVGSEELLIRPALADRAVIVRPTARMTVAPRSRVRLYVGSPLWLEVVSQDLVLYTRPVHRPSDTWFGSRLEGELCYSGRTQGRMHMSNLQPVPARAVTRVDIENSSQVPFDFDRVSLPVPSLALYRGASWLWTDSVNLSKAEEPSYAQLEIQTGPPEEAQDALLVREPRFKRPDHSRFRAFGSRALGALFG